MEEGGEGRREGERRAGFVNFWGFVKKKMKNEK